MIPLKAAPGRLIVKPMEPKSTTSGGLVIPDAAKEMIPAGEVLDVGPVSYQGFAPPANSGDVVFFPSFAGSDFEWEETVYRVLDFEDVMAILAQAPASA